MFSRRVLLGVTVAVTMLSCTPKVGEAPPEATQQKLEGTQCLSSLKPVVLGFVKGTASDAEVAQAWDCASTAIGQFKKYVYGRSEDRFTSKEVVDFLQKNFLTPGGPQISDELRIHFMKFKQLLIGGGPEEITRAELDKIVTLFGELKTLSLRINPYMKVIALNWSKDQTRDTQADIRFFEKASEETQAVADEISRMVVKNNLSYKLDDFTVFMKSYSDFFGDHWEAPAQIEKYMPVVKKVKKAISGGSEDIIAPTEWRSFVLLGIRGYVQYLRYFYFIKSAPDTGSGIRLSYLSRSVEDLFGAFQDLIRVKPEDRACGVAMSCVSKAEVMDILQTFSEVWPDFKISPKLLDEAMKIKKVYFGGSTESLTSKDFERGKNKVGNLKAVVEKFMPYYAIYSLEWDRSNFSFADAQQFMKDAQNNLQTAATDLGLLFEDSYNLDDVVVLLTEVDRLYPNKDNPDKKLAEAFGKYLPLIKDAKNIVFSENDTLIKKNQWSPFLKFSSRFFNSYVYYVYFIENEKYGSSQYLDSFKTLTDQVLNVAKDIVLTKKTQSLSEAEVRLIAQHLVRLDILPKGLAPESVEQLVKMVLNRLLWPAEMRFKGVSNPRSLNVTTIEYMRSEFQIWYETEKFGFSITANPLKPADLQNAVAKKLKDSKTSAALKTGLQEVSFLIAGPVAQTADGQKRQIISNIKSQAYGPISYSRVNLNRAIGRLLMRASIESKSRLDNYSGVTLAEALAIFNPIRQAVVELKLLAPDNLTFMESRFRDSNIFTAHGDGNEYSNFAELSDEVGMILSGTKINSSFRADVEDKCLPRGTEVDYRTTVSEKCLRKVYLDHMEEYFTSVPEYLKFYRNTNAGDFDIFFGNVLKSAGHVPNDKGTVKIFDADLTPHVIQYVEMLYSRFDADHDGIINVTEGIAAFPSFKGLLMELTKDEPLIKEKDLLALFTYILHYGQPPGGVKDFLLKWLPWKSNQDRWEVAADRRQLAGILGYIADQVQKQNKKLLSKEDEETIRRQTNGE